MRRELRDRAQLRREAAHRADPATANAPGMASKSHNHERHSLPDSPVSSTLAEGGGGGGASTVYVAASYPG